MGLSRTALSCALAALLVAACGTSVPTNAPTAYPFPSGAGALDLPTQAPHPSGIGCPLVGPPGPVVMNWDRSANAVSFSFPSWGTSDTILWPYGFSAREYLGRAELVAPDGTVVARDGDPVPGLLGTDPQSICTVAGVLY